MAQRNAWVLLTTGLARIEGENVMYTRASDNFTALLLPPSYLAALLSRTRAPL